MSAKFNLAPQRRPSAIGHVLPKSSLSEMRHGWTIGVVSVSSQSGHSVGEDVRYKASGIAFINAMIFRMDCLVVRIPSAAEV
jgi:hypothetical protein